MAAVRPTSANRANKGLFCRAKAFIRNNNASDRLRASWFAKKMKELCVIPKSAVVFPFAAVELWNYLKYPGWGFYGGCETCGTALRPSNCINEPVSDLGSLMYICCLNSESGETTICGTNKIHRSTRTTRGRVFDVNTKFAAEFTFCCVEKPNKQTYEE